MKAVDVKPTRLAAAKAEAEKLVRGLGASDRAIVVQMGSVPTPRSSMSGDQTELLQAVTQVVASDTRADLEAGLAFGRDSLRGLPHGELVVIGDGAYGDSAALAAMSERTNLEGAEPRFVPIGKSGKNLTITEFSVRRYPLDKSRVEVMLEVTNTNDRPVEAELSLLGEYNQRERELADGGFLPEGYDFIYGSADAGKELLPATLISCCDAESRKLLHALVTNNEFRRHLTRSGPELVVWVPQTNSYHECRFTLEKSHWLSG